MIQAKKVLAVIPARGGSKGISRKNILELCGKPLLGWPLQAAQKAKYVDKIIVTTDDREIAEKALSLGAEVPFSRPSELATDTAGSISVLEHALSFLKQAGDHYDYVMLLEPTSPLTDEQDVNAALEMLDSKREIADSIVGVSEVDSSHPAFDVVINEKGLIAPFLSKNFSPGLRRQDLSELYFLEGSLYISDVKVLLERKSFYHERTLPYIVPKWKALEVDDMVDVICIEAIMKNLDRVKGEKSE